jgi:hypothetical protein
MDFLKFSDALDDYRYTYGFANKAKGLAKVVGIGVVNTAIFTAKTAPVVAKKLQEQIEEQKKK